MKLFTQITLIYSGMIIVGLNMGLVSCKKSGSGQSPTSDAIILQVLNGPGDNISQIGGCPNIGFAYSGNVSSDKCIASNNFDAAGFQVAGLCTITQINTTTTGVGAQDSWVLAPILIDCSSGALSSGMNLTPNPFAPPLSVVGDNIVVTASCYVNGTLRAQKSVSYTYLATCD